MNNCVLEYFQKNSKSKLEDVIFLDDNLTLSFEELKKLASNFPRAWYELSKLNIDDRIEFTCEYILKTLPYSPKVYQKIYDFFLNIEDITVVFSKKTNENYIAELVYSMKNDSTFFRGLPPLDNESIAFINRKFNEILPQDYLNFLKIHRGFSKNFDTGIIDAENLYFVTSEMISLIETQNKIITCNNEKIDPKDLIFFYQSFGKLDFQCFYTKWYLMSDIGNVYFSFSDSSVSNYIDKNASLENMAFFTFLDWLIFYLEMIDEI
jgi:hypothetical protein